MFKRQNAVCLTHYNDAGCKEKWQIFVKFIEGKRNLILVVTFISLDSIERRREARCWVRKVAEPSADTRAVDSDQLI